MGKKTKTGKSRKDKYYQLAKETGYRARSAFKLIQLNRKFEFLQKSRVCIDLCAAPGGWLQVAHKYMPVSSIIIGVDLVPIRPIGNVITLQDDITTEKCHLEIKRTLQTWKADLVMNDGAPNVGKNWLHDAFTQNQLTLKALKLACAFLNKGGNFVTKVFRSKDYQSLIWLFQQLFKKVHATKPQASRHESAEIFVVCEKFIAPNRIDEKFFDTQYVFKEIEDEPVSKLNLMHPEKQRKRADGYAEGLTMLFHQVRAIDFILGSNHIELLETASEFVMNDVLSNHSLTTDEIKECCKDIKVLGRREIRLILTWRKKMKEILEKSTVKTEEPSMEVDEKEEVKNEEDEISEEIRKLKNEEALEQKRKKRKILKERKKLRDKMDLKMLIPNDEPIVDQDESLFQIARIKSKKQLTEVEKGDISFMDDQEVSDQIGYSGGVPNKMYSRDQHIIDSDGGYSDMSDMSDADEEQINSLIKRRNKKVKAKTLTSQLPSDTEESESEDELSFPSSSEDDDDEKNEEAEKNPLLVDAEEDEKLEKKNRNINMWFQKDVFKDLENEIDEDLDLEIIIEKNKSAANTKGTKTVKAKSSENCDESDENSDDSEMQVVPEPKVVKPSKKKRLKLDPEGLALGTMMIKSKKARRDIIDASYNRYTFNDKNLPSWFTENEEKHCRKQIPVSKELMADFKEKLKEINSRPIKKVAEAKARKKKRQVSFHIATRIKCRMESPKKRRKVASNQKFLAEYAVEFPLHILTVAVRKMERAKKKAEAITDTSDMTEKEKSQQIQQIYKKAVKGKKNAEDKEVAYVVAKKGVGRRVRRPAGVSGRFKVVDARMKKDNRVKKNMDKMSKKRGGKRGSKTGRKTEKAIIITKLTFFVNKHEVVNVYVKYNLNFEE
ncbi:pre-rRNA processing protein FTSJ3 [Nymphon striatum]|nr:pre-rRNA processing protein FTSJ3 [Nymphon striatum]